MKVLIQMVGRLGLGELYLCNGQSYLRMDNEVVALGAAYCSETVLRHLESYCKAQGWTYLGEAQPVVLDDGSSEG